MPYEPRIDYDRKEIFFNGMSMNLGSAAWRAAITDLVEGYREYLGADGVFLDMVKPQHYGSRSSTRFMDIYRANESNPDFSEFTGNRAGNFLSFDRWVEAPCDWFLGMRDIFNLMRDKTDFLVLDLWYFGLNVYHYAPQIIGRPTGDNISNLQTKLGISFEEAYDLFYDSIREMGNAADCVIPPFTPREDGVEPGGEITIESFAQYRPPADIEDGWTPINPIAFRSQVM